jgi:hypothetical protein
MKAKSVMRSLDDKKGTNAGNEWLVVGRVEVQRKVSFAANVLSALGFSPNNLQHQNSPQHPEMHPQ